MGVAPAFLSRPVLGNPRIECGGARALCLQGRGCSSTCGRAARLRQRVYQGFRVETMEIEPRCQSHSDFHPFIRFTSNITPIMSSPSGSSTSSYQSQSNRTRHHASGSGSATSSGRTTPEPHNLHHLQKHHSAHGQVNQSHNSKVLPQTIYGSSPNSNAYLPHQPARRSSTPSQGFLKPLFFSGFHQQHQHSHHTHSTTSSPAVTSEGRGPTDPPRRTSFGSALGSRLGALSALGVSSGWGPPTPSSQTPASPRPDSSSASSVATSPNLKPIDSMRGPRPEQPMSASSDSVPLAKPKPRKDVERRHICVPDGCGGFVTVEQK